MGTYRPWGAYRDPMCLQHCSAPRFACSQLLHPWFVQMKALGAAVAVTHQKCPIFLPAQELLFHGRGYWAIFAPHPQAKHSTGQQGCAVRRRRW